LSLRARLIAAIGLLLAGALLLFDLLFYTVLSDHLARDFDNTLRVRAADVATALTPDVNEKMDADDIRPGVLEPTAVDDASKPEGYVQILDVTGHIIATSGTKLPVDRGQARRVLGGVEDIGWVGSDERLRLLSRPVITASGKIVGVIQVAQSARFLDSALGEVRTLIESGMAITLLATVAIGWLLIGRALRPVSALTSAADHIVATGRLDARIVHDGSSDEVGTLVRSFNLMVGRLERSFTQQRQLLADTSHELRNPLTVLRANLEIIEEMDASDELYEVASEAHVEVVRMTRLVNDLLLLGQGDSSQALEWKPVDLAPLLDRITERARLVSAGHEIEASAVEPLTVTGDADRLYQAIWNLVENALRYTPVRGRVSLALRGEHGQAVIRVQDDGPGIGTEHQGRIFERFYRVDSARSRRSGGTGLGLAIVKWIAEAHGGQVTLTTQPGQGCTFEISVPALTALPSVQLLEPQGEPHVEPQARLTPAAAPPPAIVRHRSGQVRPGAAPSAKRC
jgi:signal transduction histidine kinase